MRRYIIKTPEIRHNATMAVAGIQGKDNLEVVIQPHKEDKSAEQRSFWHVLIGIISDETGYRKDEVKELIKKKILGTKTIKIGNIEKEVTESSEAQDKIGYSELISHTYELAAEAGIVLPSARWEQ